MRLLLDTHVALWAIADDARLSARARSLISADDAALFVSVVSLWEIAIKFARRRGRPNDMVISAAEAARNLMAGGCEILPVTPAHALAMENLPPLHRDPFDRMLIAQAQAEPLRLITADAQMSAYGDAVERV
jgi:PIN domain nuclease of toxin-antitoxin system